MVLQPVHERIPRGRVRGGFASADAGRPVGVCRYLLSVSMTVCLLTACAQMCSGYAGARRPKQLRFGRGHERIAALVRTQHY